MSPFLCIDETARLRRLLLSLAGFLLVLGWSPEGGVADVGPPGTAANQGSSSPDSPAFGDPGESSDSEIPQVVIVAIYLLMLLIVAVGGALILLLLWGSRMRRQARQPLPETTPNDPLWYLKASKSASGQSETGNDSQEKTEKSDPDDSSQDSSSPSP